jgi:serine/threonine-protein kinase HipA
VTLFRLQIRSGFDRTRGGLARPWHFAYILDEATGAWALTPPYDLTFSTGPGGEHAMTLAGEGRAPGRAHILRLAAARAVAPAQAEAILAQVGDAIGRWPEFARKAGVPAGRAREIGKVLGPA